MEGFKEKYERARSQDKGEVFTLTMAWGSSDLGVPKMLTLFQLAQQKSNTTEKPK